MNRVLRTIAIVGVFALMAIPSTAQIKILCLGDSITEGFQSESYRLPLWIILTSQGYSIDFVGPQYGTFSGPSSFGGFTDQQHAGWSAEQTPFFVNGNRTANLARDYQPDMALIHVGTNDIGQNGPGAVNQTIARIGQMIDQLRVHRPNITIFLAEVIPSRFNFRFYNQVTVLNSQIPSLAANKNTANSRVISVDMESRFELYDDAGWWFYMQDDFLHTNNDGDSEMATRWFEAMEPFLGNPGVAITSPSNNSSFNLGDMVTVTAATSDDLGVASVQYYLNGEPDQFIMAPPYSYSFPLTQSGPITITAVATDTSGLTQHSFPVTINVSGGSASAFTGMAAWYRSDAGIVDDGAGKMFEWLDQSGNDHHQHQFNPAKRPTLGANLFGNEPGVMFRGGQSMTCWVGMPRQSYTKVVVMRLNQTGSGGVLNNVISSGTSPYGAHAFWFNTNNRIKMYHHHNGNFNAANFATSNINTPNGVPTILMGTYSLGTGTGIVYNDNVFGGSGTVATRNNSPNIQLGSYIEQFFLNGDIAEIMIYPRVLSTADRNTIYSYLKAKFIDQNAAPILAAIMTQAGHAGEPISFVASASDPDAGQSISYAISGLSGATIQPVTGAFSFTPTAAGSYSATITASDNGTPSQSASQLVNIIAGGELKFFMYDIGTSMHRLEWNGMSQLQYEVQNSPGINPASWTTLGTVPGQAGTTDMMIPPGSTPHGYYRLRY